MKSRIVNQDKQICAAARDFLQNGSAQPIDRWQVPQNLGKAHEGQALRMFKQLEACRSHFVAPDAEKSGLRKSATQCRDHTGTVRVTARLPRRYEDCRSDVSRPLQIVWHNMSALTL